MTNSAKAIPFNLPLDLIVHSFSFLDANQLAVCSRVCKVWLLVLQTGEPVSNAHRLWQILSTIPLAIKTNSRNSTPMTVNHDLFAYCDARISPSLLYGGRMITRRVVKLRDLSTEEQQQFSFPREFYPKFARITESDIFLGNSTTIFRHTRLDHPARSVFRNSAAEGHRKACNHGRKEIDHGFHFPSGATATYSRENFLLNIDYPNAAASFTISLASLQGFVSSVYVGSVIINNQVAVVWRALSPSEGPQGGLALFDLATRSLVGTQLDLTRIPRALVANHNRIAIICEYGYLILFDPVSRTMVRHRNNEADLWLGPPEQAHRNHTLDYTYSVDYEHMDAERLILILQNKQMQVRNPETGALLKTITDLGTTGNIFGAEMSKNTLALGARYGIDLWEFPVARKVATVYKPPMLPAFNQVCLKDEGTFCLAWCTHRGDIRVWHQAPPPPIPEEPPFDVAQGRRIKRARLR